MTFTTTQMMMPSFQTGNPHRKVQQRIDHPSIPINLNSRPTNLQIKCRQYINPTLNQMTQFRTPKLSIKFRI